ncbi:MAG: VOC family protein [Proteobacteria bacterium]|nr:VOC family protein [Pseudomonadota bacterium]
MTDTALRLSLALDHAVINVRGQLDDAVTHFTRLGFQLTERGHHSLGSSNHLAVFGSDYLELLGFMPGNEGKRADLMTHPLGLTGLAFRADDPALVYDTLRARDLPALEPLAFERPVALPDGTTRDARFSIVRFPAGTVPNGRSFFCHHHTPELVWRPEWQVHRNGALGVAEFTIAAREPARTATLYESMFGKDLMSPVAGGVAFKAPTFTLLILTPAAIAERYNGAAPESADGSDRMVALGIAVKSLETPRAVLDGEGVPYTPLASGGLVVPHGQAGNAALAFLERA